MGLPELRSWIVAALDSESATVGGTTLTLRQAAQAGHAVAVAAILNRPVPSLLVNRGLIPTAEFNASWTAAMNAQLTTGERNTLNTWLTAELIDLSGPATSVVLVRVGYPLTRPGSPAEFHLGRQVTEAEVEDRLIAWGDRPVRRRIEDRLVCETDGTISIATLDDGVERSRRPRGRSIPAGWARPDLTEYQINRALQGVQPA